MRQHKKYILWTVLLSLFILWTFYKNVLFHPNSFLFNAYGDGIKNYYTCAYHVKHDKGWVHFDGMRYPTFDHVTYSDCQPAMTDFVKLLSKAIPPLSDYMVGIMNTFMFFSIIICAIFVLLILFEFGVGKWYAVFSAVAIAFLSPQVLRFTAHYALSYCFAIPVAWYLIIQLHKHDYKKTYMYVFFAYNLFLFFIHPYLGITITLFMALDLFFSSVVLWKKQSRSGLIKHVVLLLFPLAVFKIFMYLTDHHPNRPENPTGLFEYNANPTGVFLPYYSFLQPHLNEILKNIGVPIEPVGDEGRSYIGLATTITLGLALLAILIIPLFKIFGKKLPRFYDLFSKQMFVWFLIGLCFLFLSFAYPFKWNVDLIYKLFPPFKQFRGLGRFAWTFYYISTVFTIYFIYKFYEYFVKLKQKEYIVSYFLLLIVPASYLIESKPLHKEITASILHGNLFDDKQLGDSYFDALRFIDKDKYQCILPLPYYDLGSESYSREPENKGTMLVSQVFSYYANLPIVGGVTGRASLDEARNSIQIVAPAFYDKPILGQFLDRRKILITLSKDNRLTDNESNIFLQSRLLYDCESFSLLEISYDQLSYNTSHYEWDTYSRIKSVLFPKGGFLLTGDSYVYYNGYEDQAGNQPYFGKRSLVAPRKNFNVLAEFPPNTFIPGEEYVASFWMYSKGENRAHTFVGVDDFDQETQKGAWNYYTDGRFAEVFDKDWSFIELKFKVTKANDIIKIFVKGVESYEDDLVVDELLVRKSGINVYKELMGESGEKILFLNNHLVKY